MLDAAGIPAHGLTGLLRVNGMMAVWAYTLRAWERDEGADLPATMAALDRALDRAVQAEEMIPGRRPIPEAPPPPSSPSPAGAVQIALPGPEIAAAEDGPAVL